MMKQINLKLTALAMLLAITSWAQPAQRQQMIDAVRTYIDENIRPALADQQQLYLSSLTGDEKAELDALPGWRTSNCMYNRGGQRNNNNGAACQATAERITANHAKQNKAYQKFYTEHRQQWINDLNQIHADAGLPNRGGDLHITKWIDRMESPEALLLMDPDFRPGQGQRPMKGAKGSMKGPNGKKMGKRGGCMAGPMASNNRIPDGVIEEKLLPELIAQREAFDANLNAEEKETIQKTRDQITVRKAMFKAWYDSDDFVPGARRNDPNFDNMRTEMQSSMQQIRTIALNHSAEIKNVLQPIKDQLPDWTEEMNDDEDDPDMVQTSSMNLKGSPAQKWTTPMGFLLFDPVAAAKDDFMAQQNMPFVAVFPQEISTTGTVKISKAQGKPVRVVLNTGGDNQQLLFDGEVNTAVFSVPFSVKGMEAGDYSVTISLDGNTISRKISVVNP